MNRKFMSVCDKFPPDRQGSELVVKALFAAAALGATTIGGNAFRFGSTLTLLDAVSFIAALMLSLIMFSAMFYLLRYFFKNIAVHVIVVAISLSGIFISSSLLPSSFIDVNFICGVLIITSFAYFYFCSTLLLTKENGLLATIAFLLICVPPGLITAFSIEKDNVIEDVVAFELAPDISTVKLKNRPDIYLIGLLSASPENVLIQTLGQNNFKLERSLAEKGFKNFNHVFSPETTTRKSYDAILAMSPSYAEAISENERTRGKLFSGNVYSPLFDIFTRNGYKINIVTEDYKFGYVKGQYIDSYEINTPPSICNRKDLISSTKIKFVFLSGCLVRRLKIIGDYSAGQGGATKLLVKSIKSHSGDALPNLFLAHLKPPVHAPADFSATTSIYDIEKFHARYVAADNQAATNVLQIFKEIQSTNKSFIVLVFGDRGVGILNKISKNANFSDLHMDRKAVLASIFPAETCNEFIKDSVTTTPKFLQDLLSCLSGSTKTVSGPSGNEL